MTALLHLARVLAGRTYVPLACSLRPAHRREWLTRTEFDVFAHHHRLLCPCGGSLLSTYRPHTVKESLR